MRQLAMGMILLAGPVQAGEWVPISGGDIAETLTGQVVQYENAWQDFRASGRTLYNAGRDSWGYWAVRGDQYCSMWPPSDLWACYDMEMADDRIRFLDGSGEVTEGTLQGPIKP